MKMTIFLIFLLLLLNNCKENNKNNVSSSDTTKIGTFDYVNKNLANEIKSFILYCNNKLKKNEPTLYIVCFCSEEDKLNISIRNSLFYNSSLLYGYIMFENKMIAFYPKNHNRFNDLLNLDGLLKNNPKGFIDQDSQKVEIFPFDPYGRTYLVHDKDSLELIANKYLGDCEKYLYPELYPEYQK